MLPEISFIFLFLELFSLFFLRRRGDYEIVLFLSTLIGSVTSCISVVSILKPLPLSGNSERLILPDLIPSTISFSISLIWGSPVPSISN